MKRRALTLLLALAALTAAAWLLPARELLMQLGIWAEMHPRTAWAGFILAYVLAAVCMVPGSILTLAAGVVFGVAGGVALVSVASTMGAGAAFLAGRYLARGWVESRLKSMPRFAALDRAVARRGWLIVLLARLSIVIPYNLLNYALGLTRVRFGAYLASTFAGMLPAIFLYVYLGSVAGNLAALDRAGESALPQWLLIAGLIVAALLLVVIARITARALRSELAASAGEGRTDQKL